MCFAKVLKNPGFVYQTDKREAARDVSETVVFFADSFFKDAVSLVRFFFMLIDSLNFVSQIAVRPSQPSFRKG